MLQNEINSYYNHLAHCQTAERKGNGLGIYCKQNMVIFHKMSITPIILTSINLDEGSKKKQF